MKSKQNDLDPTAKLWASAVACIEVGPMDLHGKRNLSNEIASNTAQHEFDRRPTLISSQISQCNPRRDVMDPMSKRIGSLDVR